MWVNNSERKLGGEKKPKAKRNCFTREHRGRQTGAAGEGPETPSIGSGGHKSLKK